MLSKLKWSTAVELALAAAAFFIGAPVPEGLEADAVEAINTLVAGAIALSAVISTVIAWFKREPMANVKRLQTSEGGQAVRFERVYALAPWLLPVACALALGHAAPAQAHTTHVESASESERARMHIEITRESLAPFAGRLEIKQKKSWITKSDAPAPAPASMLESAALEEEKPAPTLLFRALGWATYLACGLNSTAVEYRKSRSDWTAPVNATAGNYALWQGASVASNLTSEWERTNWADEIPLMQRLALLGACGYFAGNNFHEGWRRR